MSASNENITQLLGQLRVGRREAYDKLFPRVYDELHKIAERQLQKERKAHTINATALIHEAYMKIAGYQHMEWQNKSHFYAVAAQAMRRILVSYARSRKAEKRGGKIVNVTFDDEVYTQKDLEELIALDEALTQLEAINERHARVVEYRFFAGLTLEETAEALNVSTMTVTRDWRMARAWLKDLLSNA